MKVKLYFWRGLAGLRALWGRLPFPLRLLLQRPAGCLREGLLPRWSYRQWRLAAEPQAADREPMGRHLRGLAAPTIALIQLPAADDPRPLAQRCPWLEQLWFEPDLLVDGASAPSPAQAIAAASTRCDYLCVVQAGEEIRPWAIYYLKQALAASGDLALVYSDEDGIGPGGEPEAPRFAGGFDRFRFLAEQRLPGLVLVRADALGALDAGNAGGWAGIVAALVQRLRDDEIGRIEMVLLSRVTGSGVAQLKASQAHLPVGWQRQHLDGAWALRPPAPAAWPTLAVIVPTRDAAGHVRRCLDSIERGSPYPGLELVLVDNQSRDPEALHYFRELEHSGRVRRLSHDAPFNFAAICNAAAQAVTAEYLVFLNNDTEVLTPDWLQRMVAFAALDSVGCVGAKLLYPGGRVQHAGLIMGLRGVVGYPHSGELADSRGYDDRLCLPRRVSAVSAACLMVQRSLYESVGGMNEKDLPVAFNDVDLCLRIEQAGKQNVWLPDVKLLHHESATRGSDHDWRTARRFMAEANYMKRAWNTVGYRDHAYNRNLSLDSESFALHPRPEPYRPWETIVDN